jgi:stage II sporulation protein R
VLKQIFLMVFVLFCTIGFYGCGFEKEDVVRIHIRANSNNDMDQDIKLLVRDEIVSYITPLIAECEDSKEVKGVLKNNLDKIEMVADEVLGSMGVSYVSTADIRNEYFPTRCYGEVTFPADYYDALIIELGSGVGDNWWCVAYPPLCFIGEDVCGENIKYKSKIIELINKFLG